VVSNVPSRTPLPKTTPKKVEFGIDKIDITTVDGRKITVYVNCDQGFYRESEMKLGNRTLQVQEVYITNGKVLKRKKKSA
jgi:hypothetical protein